MARRRGEINDEMDMACGAYAVVVRLVWGAGPLRFVVLVGLALWLSLTGEACLTGGAGLTEISSAASCVNEARRVEQGSTYLPDCRAYELVTPAEKGATQALAFGGLTGTAAIPAEDGERLALSTHAFLGANPGSRGTNVVFSRGASGWDMTSLQPASAGEVNFVPDVFTSNLTQVGVEAYSSSGEAERHSPTQTFEVGPPGGPYSIVATTSWNASLLEHLTGASRDFSHVVLSSVDQGLLPPAVGTVDSGAPNLYDWVDGQLRIVNVTSSGKLVSECGAVLGYGPTINVPDESGAVSGDGSNSKIFFTSPQQSSEGTGPGCTSGGGGGSPPENPHRLYMRVNDSETVEVSAPQLEGSVPCDPGTWSAKYQGASVDGSKVFFISESELTSDHTGCRQHEDAELYEYNTDTGKLTRISRGEPGTLFDTAEANVKDDTTHPAVISDDGSAVYFLAGNKLTDNAAEDPVGDNLYRYDTVSNKIRFVAAVEIEKDQGERAYTTPNGEFYLFASQGVSGEPRGQGHNEIYLYSNADGRVVCVSCGSGVAPALGSATSATIEEDGILRPGGLVPPFIPMSEDGRYVFFDSTARLVPQDTNSDTEESPGSPGQDVYEWEAAGVGGCVETNGCTHLISSGTDEHASVLLGASEDGSNVFFATFAQLVPQDVDTQPDVYDARVDGGFAAPAAPVRCSGESCRLIPAAPPVISTPLSATFSGVGNVTPTSEPGPAVRPKQVTQAQQFAEALRACRAKRDVYKRRVCKSRAMKKYEAKANSRKRGR